MGVEDLALDVGGLIGLALSKELLEACFEARGYRGQRRYHDGDRKPGEARLQALDRFIVSFDKRIDVCPAVDIDITELEKGDIGLVADTTLQDRSKLFELRKRIPILADRRVSEYWLPKS